MLSAADLPMVEHKHTLTDAHLPPFPWVAVLYNSFPTDTQNRAAQSDIAMLGTEKDSSNSAYKEKHPVRPRMGSSSGCLARSSCRTSRNKLVGIWFKYAPKTAGSNSAATVMIKAQASGLSATLVLLC